jgi:hydrogenase nickel incorporation protein HypA/HybF
MHEFSLVATLLDQIERIARQEHATAVTGVALQVGEFSGVDAELLRLAFEQSTAGTCAQEAALQIERVPLEGRCPACGEEFPILDFKFLCPRCGNRDVAAVRGEELILERLTLVRDEP